MEYTKKELLVLKGLLENLNVNMKEVSFFVTLLDKTAKLAASTPEEVEPATPAIPVAPAEQSDPAA